MKNILWLLLLLFASFTIQAQTDIKKVASVDTAKFFDENNGIKSLSKLYSIVYYADSGLTFSGPTLKREIEQLERRIGELKCRGETAEVELANLSKAKVSYESLEKQANERVKKLKESLLDPAIAKIKTLLRDYAAQRGFAIVVEKTAVLSFESPILLGDPPIDMTADFINFCNTFFERTNSGEK